MKLKPIFVLPILLALALVVGGLFQIPRGGKPVLEVTTPSTEPAETAATSEPTEPTEEVTDSETEKPTEEATEVMVEGSETTFTLTFVGD